MSAPRRPRYRFYIDLDAPHGFETTSEWAGSPAAAVRRCRARAHRAGGLSLRVDPIPDAMITARGELIDLPRVQPGAKTTV